MNNYKKVLSAVAGLSLASAAGMFAQEAAPVADAEFSLPSGMSGADFFKQSVVQDLSWSVEAVYAMTDGDEAAFGADLYGIRLGVAYQMSEVNELTISLSYLTGENDYFRVDQAGWDASFSVDRIELSAGYNRWFPGVFKNTDIYVGGEIGWFHKVLSADKPDNAGGEIVDGIDGYGFTGALRAGLSYKISETTRIEVGARYVLPVMTFNSDYYDRSESDNETETYLMLSAGFEFKF